MNSSRGRARFYFPSRKSLCLRVDDRSPNRASDHLLPETLERRASRFSPNFVPISPKGAPLFFVRLVNLIFHPPSRYGLENVLKGIHQEPLDRRLQLSSGTMGRLLARLLGDQRANFFPQSNKIPFGFLGLRPGGAELLLSSLQRSSRSARVWAIKERKNIFDTCRFPKQLACRMLIPRPPC